MELQTEIVSQVLDIISRPMWWGISVEVGSKVPFSHAYFPYEHQLLRILAVPISLEYFQQLLHKISGSDAHVEGHLPAPSRKTAASINAIDHRSMWAIAMNFPCWFYFASMMLFCKNGPADNLNSESIPFHDQEVNCHALSAKYIAWILNPTSVSNQGLSVDYLVKVSDLWTLRYSSPSKHNDVSRAPKETRMPKLHDKEGITSHEVDSWTISLLLKDLKELCIKHFVTKVGFSASNTKGFSIIQNPFLRRIPLGILLLYPNHLNGAACSLLLHYAATGIIPKCSGKQNSGKIERRWRYDPCGDSELSIERSTKAEAIAGCRTVFDITDIAESIYSSLFETEEDGLSFVGQVKLKSFDYLLKCINRLLEIKMDDDPQMQRDLLNRILRWRCQGRNVFLNNKEFDRVCDALNV